MAIFKYFAKAICSEGNLSNMADLVDEIEIGKIRNKQKSFLSWPSLSFMDPKNCFGLIGWKKQLKKTFFFFLSTYGFFFRFFIRFTITFFFFT